MLLGLVAGMLSASPVCARSLENGSGLKSAAGVELTMPVTHMALTARLIGPAVEEVDWFNWCVSPIMGEDGKVHIFSSRWPKSEGMEGWQGRHAQIAHFVGDRPEGPFRYVGPVLTSDMLPDSLTMAAPHNPRLEYVDGKYVLLYICQNPSRPGQMRIGMMIADRLEGPWRFAGDRQGIVVDAATQPGHWTYGAKIGVCNPAFLKIGDEYRIYFSCVTKPHNQASHSYGCAVAERLEGPYRMEDKPVTDNISYIEDAQAFEQDGKYYLLTTDNFGRNTGLFGALILWESKDGREFRMQDAKIAMGTLFDYWGDEADRERLMSTPGVFVRSASGKLERPAILKIKGKPAYLYAVGGVNLEGGPVSKSYVFKIDWKKGK